jgi:TolB-like protein
MDARLSVAMAPFVATGPEREGTAAVEQNLENALVEQERFYVLDRTRIEALVTEWQLVVEDLTTGESELLRLGEALSSDVTMMGTVKESGESVEVYSRLVDTQSGAIIIEKDVFHEKKSLRNMRDLLFGLGLKLEAALPRLTGTLTQMRGDLLEVRMENAGLLPIGAHLLLLGEGTAATALPGAQTISGQARIEAIGEHQLSARLLRGDVGINTVVLTK